DLRVRAGSDARRGQRRRVGRRDRPRRPLLPRLAAARRAALPRPDAQRRRPQLRDRAAGARRRVPLGRGGDHRHLGRGADGRPPRQEHDQRPPRWAGEGGGARRRPRLVSAGYVTISQPRPAAGRRIASPPAGPSGYVRDCRGARPSGRRRASGWSITSPTIASIGPGGWVVAVSWERNRPSASAPDAPASAAASFAAMALKRKPAPANLATKRGGVIFAVAVMWP